MICPSGWAQGIAPAGVVVPNDKYGFRNLRHYDPSHLLMRLANDKHGVCRPRHSFWHQEIVRSVELEDRTSQFVDEFQTFRKGM